MLIHTINLYVDTCCLILIYITILFAGFQDVVGAIDGIFVKIQAPQLNESDYVNRKGYYSLNVQVIDQCV